MAYLTERGNQVKRVGGFKYVLRKDRMGKNGELTWRCRENVKFKCPASIRTLQGIVLDGQGNPNHSHPVDPLTGEVRQVQSHIRSAATAGQDSTRSILAENMTGLSQDVLQRLPKRSTLEDNGEPSNHEEGSLPKKRKLGPPEAPTDGSEDCSQRSKQLAPMLIPLHPPHCNQTAFRATASGTQSIKERGSVKNSHPAKPKKHQALILNDLLEDATFADVTLTAEGQSVKAHKAVLSAMSPYFRSVLQNNPSPHPIIIMPLDMKFEDLKGIINYIYVGEIIVPSENLSSLFKAARVLQISDLSTIDATGLNTPGASSSSSNTQLTHNVDTATPTRTLDIGDTATPTRTNQSDGVRVCTRRKDDINKMQSSNRIQKRTVSSATDHLDKSQKHIHIWANHTAADTDDPLDISNHKRPEGGSSSEQTKDKSSFLEDLPVFLPDGETLSSDIDCDYLEQHEKEFIDSQLHYQGSEWVFHQAPSIISGELNNDATSPVHIKEEFN